jgi:superfamily II DNA or RNA helicase
MVLTEGWDQPDVSCIVLARPTKSHGLFRQMIGRVIRPAPGKDHALVLDHAGAVFTHGFVEDAVRWTLAQDKRAEVPAQASRGRSSGRVLVTCPECHAVRMQGDPCSACGWQPRRKPDAPDVVDGELARIDRARRARPENWTADERRGFHAMLLYIANERGYNAGWAAYKYKERFQAWPASPKWAPPPPMPPDAATRAWVKSRHIAYAKAMQKRGAA